MSEPRIETDEERDARKRATVTIGKDNHGKPVFALMLIDPKGHLVQSPIGTQLKGGWRYATPTDDEMKLALERERQLKESGELTEQAPSAPSSSETPAG